MKSISSKNIDRNHLLLFLCFLLIFTLFINWGTDNSWSRYDLTASMADEQTFNIANYSHNTIDKLFRTQRFFTSLEINGSKTSSLAPYRDEIQNNDSIYRQADVVFTDKAPGSSFLALPGYKAGEFIAESLGLSEEDKWTESGFGGSIVYLSLETRLQMVLIVFSVSALFGALLVSMAYEKSKMYVSKDLAFYTALILGLSTPLITYSSNFFGVINAAFFGFGSAILMEKAINDEKKNLIYLSGIFSALAFTIEFYAAIIPFILTIYLFGQRKGYESLKFISGVLAGSIPLFMYNWATTGNPLVPPILSGGLVALGPKGQMCASFIPCGKLSFAGFILDFSHILNAFIRLLFFPSRGLLFYSPILLLSILGCYELYKKDRKKLLLYPGITVAFLLFQAARMNWLAGSSFGPRYAIVGLSFLAPVFALGIKKTLDFGKTGRFLIILLVLISTFNIFLGFGSWGEPNITTKEYQERFTGFEPIFPDFYSEKLENFRDIGPRSELLMSMTDRYKGLDITYRTPYGASHFELSSIGGRGILFSTHLLPILITAIILTTVLWNKSESFRMAGILSITIIIAASISFSGTYYSGETYDEENLQGAVNGSISMVVHGNKKIPYFELVKQSPQESVNITVIANEKRKRSFQLTGNKAFNLPLHSEGRNAIRIESNGCTVPALVKNSTDRRCLSFGIKTFSMNSTEDFEKPVIDGFYGDEISNKPWMGRESGILFVPKKDNSIPYIEMKKISFAKNNSLEFHLNGKYASTLVKEEGDLKKIYFMNSTTGGEFNHLKIKSQKCAIPSNNIADSRDDRCLSYQLQNFSIIPEENYTDLIFMEGWHRNYSGGRWMKSKAKIIARTTKPNSTITMDLEPYSKLENNTVEISVNGEGRRNISLTRRKEVLLPIENSKKINEITLRSHKGCLRPSDIGNSSDNRCLSVYFRKGDISFGKEKKYRKGWYTEEKTRFETYRWMSNKSYIVYDSSGGPKFLVLSAKPYEELENNTLKVFADGKKIAELDENETENSDIYMRTDPGRSVIRFESSKGCLSPAEVEENSEDQRCLSFRFDRLNIKEKKYEYGWYSREGGKEFSYRWMRELSSIRFPSDGSPKKLVMEFKPYKHLENPVLKVVVNDELIGKLKLEGPGRVRETIKIPTQKGANKLELESQTGCKKPTEYEQISNDRRCLSFQFNELQLK